MNSHDFDNQDAWMSRFTRPHFLDQLATSPEDAWIDQDAATHASDDAPEKLPFELYLPERYEPKYHYPVLIWLHEDGHNEQQLQEVMPAISDQNYIGIAFRGTSDDGRSEPGEFEWNRSAEKVAEFADEVRETLAELKRFMRIDENRIALVGFDGGATMSLELLLHAPEMFSSAISFGGEVPETKGHGSRFRMLSSRRVLLGIGRDDKSISHQKFIEQARALDLTGLQVETRVYNAAHDLTPAMLREVDHWLMAACASAFV